MEVKISKFRVGFQYLIWDGLCNIKYIQGYNPNNHGYCVFASNVVGKHAYNFGPPHIETL
jgi:hypothetical protein